MDEGFRFPSQLWVLLNEEDVPVNLIFVTDMGSWVRDSGEWVPFEVDDNDPMRRFEGMQIAPVDPRIIDLWDMGDVTEAEVDDYEYKWAPPEQAETPAEDAEEGVTAAVFNFSNGESALAEALREVLADNIWAYHHAQGYHWNVKGPQFAEYHALFLTIYEDYLAAIDPTAENLLKIRQAAPYTQEDLDKFRSIPDVPATETAKDMAAALLTINDGLRESTKAAFDAASAADQQGMVDFFGARLDILDKWSWQLRASIA